LEAGSATVSLLAALHAIIDRWQLVEFRPTLDTVVQRLESPQYEIAVFGRVNSGKSSLLNHIAGAAVLPVGVTPVTAVPTRLVRGAPPQALVRFAEMEPRQISISDLPRYASEQGNPGNQRHVTAIEVRLPADRLREGVVLVDTPGIGSLAASGSAETLAYLPRCDLGIALVDAAGTLTEEDLGLLRALAEGGIAAQVLLSKADLLSPADREQTLNYIREHLRRELATPLPVHAVSTVGRDAALLDHWFADEIAPQYERHCKLTEASLMRKTIQLQESVIAVLETMLARRQGRGQPGADAFDMATARRRLEEADAAIAEAEHQCRCWTDGHAALVETILQETACRVVKPPLAANHGTPHAVARVLDRVLVAAGQRASQTVTRLQQTLGRALQTLQEAAPLASVDVQAVRNFECRGLPGLELPPALANARVGVPWWARPIPPLAVYAVRQEVREEFGAAIQEQVQLYDSQLRAWLSDTLRQLVERYQSQAEVLREQLRRLARPVSPGSTGAELDELRRDLEELQAAPESGSPAALA